MADGIMRFTVYDEEGIGRPEITQVIGLLDLQCKIYVDGRGQYSAWSNQSMNF